MNKYHGIVIKESVKAEILPKLNILGMKKASDENFTLLKISFTKEKLGEMITLIKENLNGDKWYAHFYKDEDLIVIFKDKVFRIKTDKSTWKQAVNYGLKKEIPERQMNIRPVRIEDEKL